MADEAIRNPITLKPVLYRVPGDDAIAVHDDLEYRNTDTGRQTIDVYRAASAPAQVALPAVVFVVGYSDPGARRVLGCATKDMEAFQSWARLVAASGMAAVTYLSGSDPAGDLSAVLAFVRERAGEIGVDAQRIGLWVCSGHGPNGMAALAAERTRIRCASFLYPFLIDLSGATAVREAAATYRFVNPAAGLSIADLPNDVPLFIARAGRDEFPGINDTIDRFAAAALAANMALTLVNHPTGPHAFDLLDDSPTTRTIIAQVLMFLRARLVEVS